MNRIWEHIQRAPPTPGKTAQSIGNCVQPLNLALEVESLVGRRFVICEEWRIKNAPDAPENPHPWEVIGVMRASAYTARSVLLMAPVREDGTVQMSRVLRIPAGKVGVAARQD